MKMPRINDPKAKDQFRKGLTDYLEEWIENYKNPFENHLTKVKSRKKPQKKKTRK